MDEETNVRHWTDAEDSSFSDIDRTKNFVDYIGGIYELSRGTKNNEFSTLEERKVNIDDLFKYLTKHPDMLEYEFDENKKISKIKVDPDRTLTFFDDSIQRQCNMSYGIAEMLKLLTSPKNSDLSWQTEGGVKVEMSNELYCKDKGHTMVSKPNLLRNDNAASAGGSKSRRRHRRKPVRKTRRGCTRKSKAKAKSKTHRHRRHSRVRKHKKYTSRRR